MGGVASRVCIKECTARLHEGIAASMASNHESGSTSALTAASSSQWSIVLRQSSHSDREYERQLRLVLRAVLAGTWEADFIAERLTWSPEMYSLHGLAERPEPWQLDDYLSQLVHPDDRALAVTTLMRMAAGVEPEQQVDLEYRIIRPDGTMLWIGSIGSVERDHSGRTVRARGIARDISSRRQAELAQRDADRFIARITEVAPTLIYVYDLETGRRVYNNGWLPEALGYTDQHDTDVRAFIDRTLHPDDRGRLAAYRRSHPASPDGVVSQVEFRARHRDGSWRWMLSRNLVFARNEDGSARQLIGTTTDITDIKRTEEELRRLNVELERRVNERTADLAAANRELEAFAYSVSHDLRGPLRAIGGFSNAVLETCGRQLDEKGRRYLSLVTAGVKRMGDMIEGLLALSRTTRHDLLLKKVDLSSMACEVLEDLQHAEPNRSVEIVVAPQVEVTGDVRLLRMALDNLFGNAWKFTSRAENARIEFGVEQRQGEPTYFVRDDGAGFDMANADALFVPFQRLHKTEEFEGTGIGLATVQRIVHRHGGRIWAQSAPRQGATFYFTLAVDAAEQD